jgi:transcription elongation factor GreA
MSDVVYLTKQRMKEIEDEYQYLTTVARKEIAQKIADARSHGDLSENADYDAAKEEQGLLELKISQLGELLAKSQIISSSDFPTDKVYILSKVTIKNLGTKSKETYSLVSAAEADFEQNKLAVSSPLGKALLGKVVGDVIEITTPAGTNKFEIVEIGKI